MSAPVALPGVALCVVELTYTAGAEALDTVMAEHVAWLTAGYERGDFIASGRKQPAVGGVLIAIGTREKVEVMIALSPFIAGGLATARVIEFFPGFVAAPLATMMA